MPAAGCIRSAKNASLATVAFMARIIKHLVFKGLSIRCQILTAAGNGRLSAVSRTEMMGGFQGLGRLSNPIGASAVSIRLPSN
jgi:hypothetical protein